MKRTVSIILMIITLFCIGGCSENKSFEYVNDESLKARFTISVEGENVTSVVENGMKLTIPLNVNELGDDIDPQEVIWDAIGKLEKKDKWESDELTIEKAMSSLTITKDVTEEMLDEIYTVTKSYANAGGTERPLTVEHRYIGDVPTLFMYEEKKMNLPMVVIHHGSSSRKDSTNQMGTAATLTKHGFLAVTLDAKYHGERLEAGDHRLTDILYYSANDITSIIDYAVENNMADEERIGVTGFSLGGFASLVMPIKDERVRTVVSFAGSPVIGRYTNEEVTEGEKEIYEKYNPIEQYEKLSEAAVLLLNGADDPIVSPEGARELTRIVEENNLYEGREDEYAQIEYPGLEHETNAEMFAEMENWFVKFLLEK